MCQVGRAICKFLKNTGIYPFGLITLVSHVVPRSQQMSSEETMTIPVYLGLYFRKENLWRLSKGLTSLL